MASLMGARRRVEQFASAVDGRTPVEQLPLELRELVDLVGTVGVLEAPAPRPEFSATLREQLMAEAETALAPASPLVLPPRRRGARERRLTAAAAAFTLIGGSAGMAMAAQEALPGDPLYPIKRVIEDAQLSIQTEADDRGRTYLAQAEDRLDEAGRLVDDEANATVVAETVDSFVVQSVAGSDLLLESFSSDSDPEDVQVLRAFASDSLGVLQELAKSAPDEIQDELARAAVVLRNIDQQASAACADCSGLPVLEMPVLMAQAAEISRAMDALQKQQVSNDHPALGDRPTQARAGASTPAGSGTATDGREVTAPPAPSVGGDSGLDIASPSKLPSDPGEALKDVDRETGGLLGKVGSTTEDTTEDLAEDLGDTVDKTLNDSELLD